MTTNFDVKYKEVCLPIIVPAGVYCFESSIDGGAICEHFYDWDQCDLGFIPIPCDQGTLKDEKCGMLK